MNMKWWPFTQRNTPNPRKPLKAGLPVMVVRGKYDAAQTTPDNRRHWANADGLSPNAAINPAVRRTLRNRARYEVANNSYAKGIVLTLANDTVGTGPRLQMLTPDSKANGRIEHAFGQWAQAVDLPEKLRTMRMARAETGEAFALLTSNTGINSPVKLDLKLIEADQVCTPWNMSQQPTVSKNLDGIVFDASGNPIAYQILRHHPGETAHWASGENAGAYDIVSAEQVIHYFRADRPGQWRGIPDITPALPLFAHLREYTLAVVQAAKSAAHIAIIMKTNTPAGGEAAEVEPMTEMEFVQNMAIFTPEGWEPSQIKAEQPTTTYGEFKREILNEIARCLNMPFNVAAGNSSGYNYASGRLDHQTYFKCIRVEQNHLQTVVLDRILKAWLAEAALVEGLLPSNLRALRSNHELHNFRGWFWDGVEHVDPAKEANAQATRLTNHTTTLAIEYARQGRDWEEELKQRAKEMVLMKQLGLNVAEAVTPPPPTPLEDEDDAPDPGSTHAHAPRHSLVHTA